MFVTGAVAAAMGAALAVPSPASAGYNYFCSVTGNYVKVLAYDRCAGPGYTTISQVKFSLQNGSGVYHCAGAKQYSDGSGGNAFPFGCTTGQNAYSQCYISSGSNAVYPTGINDSGAPHYYRGEVSYGGDCF